MHLTEAIEYCRAREIKETAAIVLTDAALQKMLAAWPMVPVEVIDNPMIPETDIAGVWLAMWQCVSVDDASLGVLTGLNQGVALNAYRRAKGLRLIYPDGSLHQVGKVVLQQLIKDSVKK